MFPPGRLFTDSSCSFKLVLFLSANRAFAASRAWVVFAGLLLSDSLIVSAVSFSEVGTMRAGDMVFQWEFQWFSKIDELNTIEIHMRSLGDLSIDGRKS